jgi:glutamate 5-kinase
MLTLPKRVVIKLGTNVVIENDGETPHLERLRNFAADIAVLHTSGCEVVIVSSGAIGLGRDILKGKIANKSLLDKQACATVGQPALMALWRSVLGEHQIVTAQLLLTAKDFERRESYLNLHQTIEQLLAIGVVPIINENDATSISEIKENSELSFGDNDRLSALVAARIGAQALLILTTTDGIFNENPEQNPNASQIPRIESLEELHHITTSGSSSKGRGGMSAKLIAARTAALCGVSVHISSGFLPKAIHRALHQGKGTIIDAQKGVSLRKGWIGHSSGYRGVVVINQGAKQSLLFSGSSLLPVGVVSIRGDFARYDVVQIEDEAGIQIGRGLSSFSSSDLERCKGLKTQEILAYISNRTGPRSALEAIHRDNLVLFIGEDDV